MQSSTPWLDFQAVKVTRNHTRVLTLDQLQISEHRVGLVGTNGSGKSTFLRLCNGLLQPDQGQVVTLGQNARRGPEHLARYIGFLFQNPDHQILFPTVREELAFGLRQQGMRRPVAEARVDTWLADWHLHDWADRPVHTLSEGQKQLVCLLAVLITEPSALLLDEIFSALDGLMRRRLLGLLQSLAQPLLMISHDPHLLEGFDRVLWLHNGQIRDDGPPQRVLAAYEHWLERCAAQPWAPTQAGHSGPEAL